MNLEHAYDGGAYYHPDYQEGPHALLVAVPCFVGELPTLFYALLDTASHWCILPPKVAQDLSCDLGPEPFVLPLHTRFGLLLGRLVRLPLRFAAEEGEEAEIDATWFVSEHWPGPMVIGWKGGLERFRFALDPSEDVFYFAEL